MTMVQAWLEQAAESAIRVLDEAAVSQVREAVRDVGRTIAMDPVRLEQLVTAASEVAHNQHLYAGGGMTLVRRCERAGVPGVEVIAADRGPGLADPTAAFSGAGHPTPRRSLGVGLSAAHSMVDELDADVRMGEGCCFWLRKYAEPVARAIQVGLWARAKVGERANGDDAAFLRREGRLLLSVADGLGHGSAARTSSASVADVVRREPGRSLEGIMLTADAALRGQRGAAVTLARIDEAAAIVECAAVGNVACAIETRGSSNRFGAESWTVGVAGLHRKIRTEQKPLPAKSAVLLYSDGVSSRASLADHGSMLLEHPLVIAHFVA
jgi:anti-sigma regulatory factor (Ser/Thr protein kinase)